MAGGARTSALPGAAPSNPAVTFGSCSRNYAAPVLDETDRCTWNRARQRSCPGGAYGVTQQYTQTIIDVTPGTLTRADEP